MLSYQLEDGNWITTQDSAGVRFAKRLNPQFRLSEPGLFEPYVFVDQQWIDSKYLAPDGEYFLRWEKERKSWQEFIKGLARRQADYATRWCTNTVCCCAGGLFAGCCVGDDPESKQGCINLCVDICSKCRGCGGLQELMLAVCDCFCEVFFGCCHDCASECCSTCGECCSGGGECCSGCGDCGGCSC